MDVDPDKSRNDRPRGSHFDPSGEVDLEDLDAVRQAIGSSFDRVYGNSFSNSFLDDSMDHLVQAYRGQVSGLLRCDTPYHDLRHALETGLTMARLIEAHAGTRTSSGAEPIDCELAVSGLLLALFHDIGLLRRGDEAHLPGAVFTPVHEERGVEFMRQYFAHTPLSAFADRAALIMATKLNFKIPATWSAIDRTLASMVASADLLCQMADRCYLEKCWHFLFQEFCTFGIAGNSDSVYPNRETLLAKSPVFYEGVVMPRLNREFDGVYRMMSEYYSGADPYQRSIAANFGYLEKVISSNDFSQLRRQPHTYVGGLSSPA